MIGRGKALDEGKDVKGGVREGSAADEVTKKGEDGGSGDRGKGCRGLFCVLPVKASDGGLSGREINVLMEKNNPPAAVWCGRRRKLLSVGVMLIESRSGIIRGCRERMKETVGKKKKRRGGREGNV